MYNINHKTESSRIISSRKYYKKVDMANLKFNDEITAAIYNLFFNIAGYLNHLWIDDAGILHLSRELFNLEQPSMIAKRLITQEIMNCFLNHDVKVKDCEAGVFNRFMNLNLPLITQFDAQGKSIKRSAKEFEECRQHMIEEKCAGISDVEQLCRALNTASRKEIQPLIEALKTICIPDNIKKLEVRRRNSEHWLERLISAICNFINLITFNTIAPIRGKETTKSIYGLFALAEQQKETAIESNTELTI